MSETSREYKIKPKAEAEVPEPVNDPGLSNAFVTTLATLGSGQTVHDLSEAMEEVLQAVRENGGKGSLSLSIAFEPQSKGRQIKVHPSISMKKPPRQQDENLFFVTDQNQLSRRDPDQRSFSFGE